MSFCVELTDIRDLLLIKTHQFIDERGIYNKIYEKEIFEDMGIDVKFTESSDIYSHKGILRGLHYQYVDSQAKLIHVLLGRIYDVVLDLRVDSPTYGQHMEILLEGGDGKSIYIPEGFAHGFISLDDNTIFSYQCSGKYRPEYCGGILWNSTELNIKWPLAEYGITDIVATKKDLEWPTFSEYCSNKGV